jgi:hypothetical protein
MINISLDLFLHKFFCMATSKKSTGLYWFLFLVSSAAFGAACFYHWEYLTLILPFSCTFLVKAMDII